MVETESMARVEDYQRRIRHLEEENAYLRESARTFGDLAERLKKALDAERVKQAGQRAERLLS